MLVDDDQPAARGDQHELGDRLLGGLDRAARLVELDLLDAEIERQLVALGGERVLGLLDRELGALLLELALLPSRPVSRSPGTSARTVASRGDPLLAQPVSLLAPRSPPGLRRAGSSPPRARRAASRRAAR
jgi:hypothetical protein